MSHAALAESNAQNAVSQRISALANQAHVGVQAEANRQAALDRKRDLVRERAALLAQLPENANKTMTELLQMAATINQGAQYESVEVRRMKEAETSFKNWLATKQTDIITKKLTDDQIEAKKREIYASFGVPLSGGGGGPTVDTSKFSDPKLKTTQ